MKSFIKTLQEKTPKAFKYFEDYHEEHFDVTVYPISELPFDMLLGVFLSFFNTINSDIELYSYEKEALMDAVQEAFSTYEEYLFLDS